MLLVGVNRKRKFFLVNVYLELALAELLWTKQGQVLSRIPDMFSDRRRPERFVFILAQAMPRGGVGGHCRHSPHPRPGGWGELGSKPLNSNPTFLHAVHRLPGSDLRFYFGFAATPEPVFAGLLLAGRAV